MPIHYEHDSEYKNKNEEAQDKMDATLAKLETVNKANVMDFDEFLAKERIGDAIHSKNRK